MPGNQEAREIGARVRKVRMERGLTQLELSQMSGLATSTISDIEHGKRETSSTRLLALATALAVPISRLLGVQPHLAARLPALEASGKRDILRVFAENLRAARLRRGLSQEDLATLAEAHVDSIRHWEAGMREIGLASAAKLAVALQVDIGLLLSEDSPNLFTAGWQAARQECRTAGCHHNHEEIY